VARLLLELNAEHGATLVVATHNPALAAAMSRRLRLADGRLLEVPAAAESRRGSAAGGEACA